MLLKKGSRGSNVKELQEQLQTAYIRIGELNEIKQLLLPLLLLPTMLVLLLVLLLVQ